LLPSKPDKQASIRYPDAPATRFYRYLPGSHISFTMPKILGYTPSWLSRNTSGFQVFSDSLKNTPANGLKTQSSPRSVSRLIARRGTHIFVAVGNEIRWTDLVFLKDYETEKNQARRSTPASLDSYPESLFRVSYHDCKA
jgi:hypothetical protein